MLPTKTVAAAANDHARISRHGHTTSLLKAREGINKKLAQFRKIVVQIQEENETLKLKAANSLNQQQAQQLLPGESISSTSTDLTESSQATTNSPPSSNQSSSHLIPPDYPYSTTTDSSSSSNSNSIPIPPPISNLRLPTISKPIRLIKRSHPSSDSKSNSLLNSRQPTPTNSKVRSIVEKFTKQKLHYNNSHINSPQVPKPSFSSNFSDHPKVPPPPPPTHKTSSSSATCVRRSILSESDRANIRISRAMASSSAAANATKRGALIVLEGLDRVGKTTLATKLVDHLHRIDKPVAHYRFPDRTTPIGILISELLKDPTKHIDDHAMHLLFSANRWELNEQIRQTILNGTNVIIDRYSYSGIAYSCAKRDLNFNWCREVEKGLPKPDLVIYLDLSKESQCRREGFGEERFEIKEFQEMIRKQYRNLIETSKENWLKIDVEHKGPEQVLGEVIIPVKRCIDSCNNTPLDDLDFK